MKAILIALTLALLPQFSFAESCGDSAPTETYTLEQILEKKEKVVFDEWQAGELSPQTLSTACIDPGYRCRSSGDCCGASFCRNGVCSDNGNSCRGPGASCRSSGECCGSSYCRDGYCSDNGNSCRQEGAKCRSSGDCCGSLFCRDGFCK